MSGFKIAKPRLLAATVGVAAAFLIGNALLPAGAQDHSQEQTREGVTGGQRAQSEGVQRTAEQTPIQGRDASAPPQTFGQAVAREYERLVRQETQKYEYLFNDDHFRRKMRRAAQGEIVDPENPDFYSVPGALGVALQEGRVRLMRVLEGNTRTQVPALAARAQARYDCWVSRAAMRASSDDILVCEQQFVNALDWLEAAVTPVQASDQFNQFLARDYLAYADFEAQDQQDFIDSRHFAQKGLRAAAADEIDEIDPEVIARWNLLSEDEVPNFVEWRARLIRALRRGRSEKPRPAATAQVMFDCWVERTSERNDQAHVTRCRDGFLAALRELEGPRAAAGSPNEFTVLFDFDKSDIRADQRRIIQAAAQRTGEIDARRITVVGHTDRAGSTRYNLRLSFRRAEAVKQALQAAGVEVQITTIFRGESDPAVQTEDGVRNQANRRAVITIFQ